MIFSTLFISNSEDLDKLGFADKCEEVGARYRHRKSHLMRLNGGGCDLLQYNTMACVSHLYESISMDANLTMDSAVLDAPMSIITRIMRMLGMA